MRSEAEAKRAIEKYSDTIRRICLIYMKNYADAEDIFQNVFLKYILFNNEFKSEEHEKAWLIRVAINCCKDSLKSFFRTKTVPLDAIGNITLDCAEHSAVIEEILALPEKYKLSIYLTAYEGYTVEEAAEILHKNKNTVYTWVSRGKSMLKERLGGDNIGY